MTARTGAGPRLGVVIPGRNEAARIGAVLDALPPSLPGVREVRALVVDDGSDDATAAVARAHGARVLRHVINMGKGAALRTGCEAALATGCELVAVMDADGQHLPSDLPRVVAPLVAGRADLVVTYRQLGGDMPPVMRAGNWGLSSAFRVMFGHRFQDTQCGYRAFTAAAFPRLAWRATDYSVESEMLIHAARRRLRVVEVPIATVYHDRFKGTTVADGIRILGSMLRLAVGDRRP